MLWPIFILLMLLAVGMLLYPFLKRRTGEEPSRVDFDIVVYRSQLTEIEQEIERGLLTAEEADAARAEVYRRMLAAEDVELKTRYEQPQDGGRTARLVAVFAVVLVVPLGAAFLYSALGSPNLPGEPYAWRLKHDADFVKASSAGQLEALLQSNPDGAGYKRLSEMYFDVRDFGKAAAAARHAIDLGVTDADTWSEFGEASVMANSGTVGPEALAAFANSLRQDPHNDRSRFYVGLAEAQIGNLKQAVAILRDLEKGADPNAPWLPLVRQHVEVFAKQGKFDPASVPPAPPSVQALDVSLNAMSSAMQIRSQAQNTNASQQAAAPVQMPPAAAGDDQNTMIRNMVAGFADKMKNNPNDVAGWQRLAHAYVVLGEHDKASEAARHAVRLAPNNVGVLLSLAETQKAAAPAGDGPPADFTATMRKILKLDPSNVQGLYYVGIAEERAGHATEARTMWKKAMTLAPAGDPLLADIHSRLAQPSGKTD